MLRPLLLLLLLLRPGALAAQSPAIDSIVIETNNIFDSTQTRGNLLAALMNALHVRTRPWVVRRELLFRVGEPVDRRRLEETERNLRRLRLFRDASVDTVRVADRLIARIVTYDGWTTSLETALSSTGDVVTWSVGLRERNVLGTGHALGGSYRKEPDRNAWRVFSQLNRPLATRGIVSGYYDDLSDGRAGGWSVGVPFRALGDRLAVELPGEAADRRVLRFRDGVQSDTLWRRALLQRAVVAWAPVAGSTGYLRLGLQGLVRREEYLQVEDTALVIPDSVSGAVGVFAEVLRPRFAVVTHYNGFGRDEDIDLGSGARLSLWAAPAAFGYTRGGLGPVLAVQAGAGTGLLFARLRARAQGLFTGDGLDSGQVAAELTVASRVLNRQATVLHVEAGVQEDPAPGREFDLGHGRGPRAFKPHAFTGTRALWGIAEHRAFFVDELFGMLGLGVAGFVDYGGAWYSDQAARFGGNVGLGLRIGAASATGPNVGRLDLAYRFGDGVVGSRWVFSFGSAYEF